MRCDAMRREARIRRIALKLAAKGANYGQGLASCSPLLVGTHCVSRAIVIARWRENHGTAFPSTECWKSCSIATQHRLTNLGLLEAGTGDSQLGSKAATKTW